MQVTQQEHVQAIRTSADRFRAPSLPAARAKCWANFHFDDLFGEIDTDFELAALVDRVIQSRDEVLIGKVFHALSSNYVERLAHREAEIDYTGPDAFKAVSDVVGAA